MIRTKEELLEEVERLGILPFFTNCVPGWSLEERIDPEKWFTDDDGPWEWKGPVAYEERCVYGKFVRNKAAFVSLEWFPELANYRRGGFITYEDREDAGEEPRSDSLLMRYVTAYVEKNLKSPSYQRFSRLQVGFYANSTPNSARTPAKTSVEGQYLQVLI